MRISIGGLVLSRWRQPSGVKRKKITPTKSQNRKSEKGPPSNGLSSLEMSALRAFCYVGEMTGSQNQFVLIKASKNRGGEWSPDDYDVRDGHGKVVGRIMRHPQASKDQPWLWTIVAREIPPSVHNHGYSATREQAMADFKTRWAATTA